MFGRKKDEMKDTPQITPASAPKNVKTKEILRNFAMNRISAKAAMEMTGATSMKELRILMKGYGMPFPKETDADVTPTTDLLMNMYRNTSK